MSSVNMQNAYNERIMGFYDRMIDESQCVDIDNANNCPDFNMITSV